MYLMRLDGILQVMETRDFKNKLIQLKSQKIKLKDMLLFQYQLKLVNKLTQK